MPVPMMVLAKLAMDEVSEAPPLDEGARLRGRGMAGGRLMDTERPPPLPLPEPPVEEGASLLPLASMFRFSCKEEGVGGTRG